MNNIAFFFGDFCVYRHGIIIALGVLAAVTSMLMLRRYQGAPLAPVLSSGVLGCVLISACARIVYWYCCYEQFGGFLSVINPACGGYSMVGAVIGLLLTALIVCRIYKDEPMGELLDCLAPSGLAGVCVGRLAGFFDGADKGKVIITAPKYMRLPFSISVTDTYTGEVSYRLAVFIFESAAAFLIYLVCIYMFRNCYCIRGGHFRVSDTAIGAFSLYAATQAIFDSMRYDALFLRSNGFVCLMQMLSLLTLSVCLIIAVVRAKKRGLFAHCGSLVLLVSVGSVMLLGQAAYMEYYVQRHGDLYILCYAVMLLALGGLSLMTITLLSHPKQQRRRKGDFR